MTAAWPSTGIPIRALSADARALDRKAFEAKYAKAFFVRHGSSRMTPQQPMQTRPDSNARDGESTGDIVIIVLPIRRQAGSEHPFVGIGRLEGCDIAIFDETVSKFHAYVKEQPENTFLLQDARSRNGTTVEGVPVAQRGSGSPTTLQFGQVVRFGSVTTTFVDAAALISLASRLSRA